MITVELSSKFTVDGGDALTASPEYSGWVANLPSEALLTPITVDKGNQRDPMPVCVGMMARWTEER